MVKYNIRQFDKVKIKTTKNIKYLSSPDTDVNPHGLWTVIGNNNKDGIDYILINKGRSICLVPYDDLKIIGQSPINYIKEKFDG